jgi:hypothetical protein
MVEIFGNGVPFSKFIIIIYLFYDSFYIFVLFDHRQSLHWSNSSYFRCIIASTQNTKIDELFLSELQSLKHILLFNNFTFVIS